MNTPQKEDFSNWKHHLQDEVDAAYLYRELAQVEQDAKRRDIYARLAEVEDKHVRQWQNLLRDAGEKVLARQQPSRRARFMRSCGFPRRQALTRCAARSMRLLQI